MTTVEIKMHPAHLGGSSGDYIDLALRLIGMAFGDADSWPTKYGCDYENDVFMMHRFCWCESESCLWCGGCGCDKGPVRHYWDDREVSSEEAYQLSSRLLGKLPHELYEHGTREYEKYSQGWDARVKERDRRSKTIYPAVTHSCGHTMMANRQEGADWRPNQTAPHFFYKPSGFRLWWYKYIDRDMEASPAEIPGDFLHRILETHPDSPTPEALLSKYEREQDERSSRFAEMIASANRQIGGEG